MFDNEDWARFFEERMRDPLDRAFRLLLRTAPRVTAERALRAALTVLVASDTRVPVPPHRENGAEPITDTPATPWASLRPRLHAIVSAADSAERHVIANDLQIISSTLRNICSTTVLGAAVIGRVDG